jgi:hypothetical protein
MDIDPVDDGPRDISRIPVKGRGSSGPPIAAGTGGPAHEISKEEEARQAIDMLRGDDTSQRVSAASRLQSIAAVLGPERTRGVS